MSTVMTVTGPVAATELGVTLPHEHLFINLKEPGNVALIHDLERTVREVQEFADHGGRTIVDVTTAELSDGASGRMPAGGPREIAATESRAPENTRMLAEVSRRTGVQIVAATGHYREPFLDREWFDRHSTDMVAEYLIRDIEEGFPGTAVRAGIIGEIASHSWYTTAAEERSFRAAARAHLRTGVTITTHAGGWPVGIEQLDILESEGVAPENVIVGHADSVPDEDYALAIARRGAYVQFDTFFRCRVGGAIVEREVAARAALVRRLVDAGFGDRILVSHDVCVVAHLRASGGVGYAFLVDEAREQLARAGVDEDLLRGIMTDNVRKALSS